MVNYNVINTNMCGDFKQLLNTSHKEKNELKQDKWTGKERIKKKK